MKRPRGTGSIFKRNRTWFVQYFVAGERRRESSHSEDRKVAEGLLRKRLGEVATGAYLGLAAEKVTMGQLIDLVIEDYEFRGHRSTKVVRWRAAGHFNEDFRKTPIARFGTETVKRYVSGRRDEGAENSTINRELAIIRRGFTLGRRTDPPLVQKEPPYIPHLEEDNARQGFLEPEQYEHLLAELPQHLKAFFVCAYHLGTRKGELRKVRWDQVDFEAGVIRLEQAQTKGKRPRTLPIYGDMEKWLRIQQEGLFEVESATALRTQGSDVMAVHATPQAARDQGERQPQLAVGRDSRERPAITPWVFHWGTKQVGEHMKGWKQACERAGVPGLLPHDLRRSAVRNMRLAGISEDEAMKITGHKTRSMFTRYNIVSEEDLKAAGEKMEQFFAERKADRAAKLRRVK